MSVATKMTAIADKIRNLSGATGALTLDDMVNNLGGVETETVEIQGGLTEQDSLLTELATVLAGKATGGDSEENTDKCTIILDPDHPLYSVGYEGPVSKHDGTYEDTNQRHHISTPVSSNTLTYVAYCNTIMYVSIPGLYEVNATDGEIILKDSEGFVYRTPSSPNATATVTMITD